MSDDSSADNELFEKYLDGQLSPSDEEQVKNTLSQEQAIEVNLQTQIDASLARQFEAKEPSTNEIESWLAKPRARNSAWNSRRMLLGVMAVAAAALLMFLVFPQTKPTPFFEPRQLTQLHSEAVDAGFKPYYFCEDDERFAETFAHRQGKRLVLTEMPDDRRMIGLSYLGGFTRESTAILCYVEQQPVIVFVEKSELDNNTIVKPSDELRVHRANRDGLVFYEVSSFSTPKISPFLQLAD